MHAATLDALRQQLRDQFPQAHGWRAGMDRSAPASMLLTPDAFPAGSLSEVVVAGPVSGAGLLVACFLGKNEERACHPEVAFIDGSDSFDPESFDPAACSRVLWVRCTGPVEILKAADLLARDGNVPLLLMDLTGLPRACFRFFPSSAWWRLKQRVECTGGKLVVLAPFPVISYGGLRLTLHAHLTLADLDIPRGELMERLRFVPQRLRQQAT